MNRLIFFATKMFAMQKQSCFDLHYDLYESYKIGNRIKKPLKIDQNINVWRLKLFKS